MKSKIPFAELFAGAQPPAVAPDGPQIPLFEMIRLFRSEPAAAPVHRPRPRHRRIGPGESGCRTNCSLPGI